MLKTRFKTTIAVASLLFCGTTASAQDRPLSELLLTLVLAEVRLAPPPSGSGFSSHEAHFQPGLQQLLTPFLFNQAISSQLSSFPLGSSSGGFSYNFDPAVGTFTRTSTSFGPSFAERAVTLGRRKVNIGMNYQHSSYSSFEGRDLEDGSIKFYLTHIPSGGAFFEGDLVEASLRLNLSSNTAVFFSNYGVTDRLDVGIAVPIVNVSMDATVDARVLRLATLETGPTSAIHVFPNGTAEDTFSDSGSATGIGDILLRTKYHFWQARGGGLALGVDVRLPTGDETNLLGTGAAQAAFLAIASSTYGKVSPHVNLGYTFARQSDNALFFNADEINYAGGIEFAPRPKLTLSADLIGRSLRDTGRLEMIQRDFPFRTQAGVTGVSSFQEFGFREGDLNLNLAAVGAKFNPTGNLLLSANLLFPLSNAGVRGTVTPVIGFDYSF
jgi:hypothetical protein